MRCWLVHRGRRQHSSAAAFRATAVLKHAVQPGDRPTAPAYSKCPSTAGGFMPLQPWPSQLPLPPDWTSFLATKEAPPLATEHRSLQIHCGQLQQQDHNRSAAKLRPPVSREGQAPSNDAFEHFQWSSSLWHETLQPAFNRAVWSIHAEVS